MRKLLAILIAGILATMGLNLNAENEDIFKEGDHCVAYSTEKTMFLMKDVRVVGKNCDIEASMQGGSITIKVPLNKFDSGDSRRDEHVAEILKGDIRDHLLFVSDPVISLAKAKEGDLIAIKGKLTIGNEEFPIETNGVVVGNGDNRSVAGSIKTAFANFGMEPPTVAGGIVADVHEGLNLHYRIVLSKVKGM